MKGIHISNKIAGMAAVLLSLSLFSCSSEDVFDLENRDSARNIRFGVSTPEDEAQNYLAARQAGEAIIDHFVLRSNTSRDTLCVNTVISDRFEKTASMATIATRATMQKTMYDNFNVVAQLKDTDGSLGSQFYMNETATKSGDVWQPSAIYYWPDDRQLRFMAWAPTGEGVFEESPISPTVDVNKTTIKYTVPTDASKQRDIVAAATDYMSNPATGATCSPVGLQFKHLCTAVIIKTGSDITDGSIKSVKITNVRKTGTYDMTTSAWTLAGETADYYISPDFATAGRPDGTPIHNDDAAFMMLPQTLGAESKLEVVFHDNISGNNRTLTASLNGAVWPMGKTITYRLSITPEYDLKFITEPTLQDAHYIIYPIKIKVDPKLVELNKKGEAVGGGWTLKSTSPKITLCKELTDLTSLGYWVEEDRGTQTIEGTEIGEVTVYAFIEENIERGNREVVLELTPKKYPNAKPAKFTITQLCPSFNTNGLGGERIEDGDYPWGFLWDNDMKITYDMKDAGGHGFWGPWRRWVMKIQIKYYGDKYKDYITYTTYWGQLETLTIDFSKVPRLDVADSPDDGNLNTWELYNFNGVSDVTGLMAQLKEWGGKPDKQLPENPAEYAARMCILKNKFNKELIGEELGKKTYRPVLKRENLVWYLPSKNEFSMIKDNDYPLNGYYWTSTASEVANDNENSYKYLENSGSSLEYRKTKLHVRAVRKLNMAP